MFKKNKQIKLIAPQDIQRFQVRDEKYSYERFEHKVSDEQLSQFKNGTPKKIIEYSPSYAAGRIIYCGFNGNVLIGLYEKPCRDVLSKDYKIFFATKLTPSRPRDWERQNYYPNDEFIKFLNTKLDEGYVLDKIIVNQFIFCPLKPNEKKPSYLCIDRLSENYTTLIPKNCEILQYLIDSSAQKGYRFLGGFCGARVDYGLEYSAWVFVSDPHSDSASHYILPVQHKFPDIYFCYDPIFIQNIKLWSQEGWEICSVLFGTKKYEKALHYYPVYKYSPFVVLRQTDQLKISTMILAENKLRLKLKLNEITQESKAGDIRSARSHQKTETKVRISSARVNIQDKENSNTCRNFNEPDKTKMKREERHFRNRSQSTPNLLIKCNKLEKSRFQEIRNHLFPDSPTSTSTSRLSSFQDLEESSHSLFK